MIKVDKIIKTVLLQLSELGYEINGQISSSQLIFPNKFQARGNIKRISEQELRLLFIREFEKEYPKLFYSIETPTQQKYKIGKKYNDLIKNIKFEKKSAAIDMCIFEKSENEYNRILNIEFKNKNAPIWNIAKDILKLFREDQNGVFINMLRNTDSGTFINKDESGIFNKLYKSFSNLKTCWNNGDKNIQILIFSIKQKLLIHRIININELNELKDIFFIESGCGNIKEIKENGWHVL